MSFLRGFGYVVITVVYAACWVVLLLGVAGTWWWTEGWVFLLLWDGMILAVLVMLLYRDPELLRQRFRPPFQEGQPTADKVLILLISLCFLVWFIVMPLDAVRYGWSPAFPWSVKVIGGIGMFAAVLLLYRVFYENTFLIPVVRVQHERRQRVVSTGLYGVVRHPMYMSMELMVLAGSLLLGSLLGLAAGMVLMLLFALRIRVEEETLMHELHGYPQYRKQVRFRLIPGVY